MIHKAYTITVTKGYTLVELLVAITISIIVFSVGLAGYREFSRRQALIGVIKEAKADLRLAQQLALTGQKPENVVCTRLSGYTFSRASATSYQLLVNCTNANYVLKSVNMPTDTTISASPTSSVIFKVLGQGTNLTSSLIFTIANTAAGTSGTITVGIGGDVQ